MYSGISEQFGIFTRFKPPWNVAAFTFASAFLKIVRPHMSGVTVKKFKTEGSDGNKIPVTVLSPEGEEGDLPCLVYFHGGGLVFRAAPYHWRNAAEYCLKAHCRVVMPDYRLAYKSAYPAAHNDCFSVYKWVYANCKALKVDSSRIAAGGDSAGGLLAVDVSLKAAGESFAPCCIFLVYPVLDRRCNTPSMRKFADTPMWNAVLNRKMWRMYLGGDNVSEEIYISPAEQNDLSLLPHAYIETAEFDCLNSEGEEFAKRLSACGVRVAFNPTSKTMHGFDIAGCSITSDALTKRIAALYAAFYN